MVGRRAYRFVERKDYQPTEEAPSNIKLPKGPSPTVPVTDDDAALHGVEDDQHEEQDSYDH